jgi:uncharacterized integral membrane protein
MALSFNFLLNSRRATCDDNLARSTDRELWILALAPLLMMLMFRLLLLILLLILYMHHESTMTTSVLSPFQEFRIPLHRNNR